MRRMWILSVLWGLVVGASYLPHDLPIRSVSLITYLVVEVVIYGFSGCNIIRQWDRRPVLFMGGKYSYTAGPGFLWIEPALHLVLRDVPVQDVTVPLKIENVPTADNVRLNLMLVLTTRVEDVQRYTVEVENPHVAVEERAIAAASTIVRKHPLDEFLHQVDQFVQQAGSALSENVKPWGIKVVAVEIKDLKIADPEVERAIAMKARAQKEGEAELTRANYQLQVAHKLKEAAAVFDADTWRLKGLETLIELCRSAQNNTVLIPTELLGSLARLSENTVGAVKA